MKTKPTNPLCGLLLLAGLIAGCSPGGQDEWTLSSPDGALLVTITNRPAAAAGPRQLHYRLERRAGEGAVTLLDWSPLGIARTDGDFSENLEYTGKDQHDMVDTYTLRRGKRRQVEARGRELTLHFRNAAGQPLDLIWRAYNDGVAFRYRFPGEGIQRYALAAEQSGFRVPAGARAWLQPYDSISKWTPAYERFFENDIPAGSPAPGSEGWCLPALFAVDGHWLLLSESDLDSTYHGSHLQPEAPGGLYTLRPPEADEAEGQGPVMPTATLPWLTPWRVIMAGAGLGPLVESTLITDLARPTVVSDTAWIQPGRAAWSWWSDHPSSKDFTKLKTFVDLAADMGWEYSLVDANWNVMEGGTMEELAAYAREKGVGLLAWYNSGGPHNIVEEQPRDRMLDPAARRDEFARLRQLGVRGIKVDFFQSDKPHIIAQYLGILRDAADYRLLVNFHGCTIPRGWERTYPHLMSMEAVKGAEAYSFDASYPANAPRQNTIFAATRNVIGPMDYTPVTFSDNVYPHLTTNAHELALAVVFESGILHLADRADAYRELPAPLRDLLRELPAVWDETRFLQGTPGRDFVIARRYNDTWYLAGINGEDESKEIGLDLPFPATGAVLELAVRDGAGPRDFAVETGSKELPESPRVTMAPNGGFLLKIRRGR